MENNFKKKKFEYFGVRFPKKKLIKKKNFSPIEKKNTFKSEKNIFHFSKAENVFIPLSFPSRPRTFFHQTHFPFFIFYF